MILKIKVEKKAAEQTTEESILFETISETFYEGGRIEVEADNIDCKGTEETAHTRFGYKVNVSNIGSEPGHSIMLEAVDPTEYRYSGFLINKEGKTVGRPIRSSEGMNVSI